jgi:4,5:9,10-diseco-3-hydroxy-5,9,17-trioxoandrosta-1(10),2-diene-4-oate hydrolase
LIGGTAAILLAAQLPVPVSCCATRAASSKSPHTVATFCGVLERFFAAGERGVVVSVGVRGVLPPRTATACRGNTAASDRPCTRAPVLREAWAVTPAADIRDVAATLDVPIWIAWAKHDRVIPLRSCLPAIRRLRNATVDTFDAGHTAFLEQPDAFARGFVAFVESLATKRVAAHA